MKNFYLMAAGVVLVLSCVTTDLPNDNIDELLGEWVNPVLGPGVRGSGGKAKVVWRAEGICEIYPLTSSTLPRAQKAWELERKWKDKDGSIYFELIDDARDQMLISAAASDIGGLGVPHARYSLIRLNKDKRTYEEIANFTLSEGEQGAFPSPEETDILHEQYLIYYRPE